MSPLANVEQIEQTSSLSAAVDRFVANLGRWWSALADAVVSRARWQPVCRELAVLDDHLLRDIGLDPAVVRRKSLLDEIIIRSSTDAWYLTNTWM